MAQLIAIHSMPADPVSYGRYYLDTHVPLVKRLPGLRKYVVNHGPILAPGANPAAFLIAIMHFDDLASIEKALESAEGQAAAADMPNFAKEGDIQLVMFESQEI